MVVAVIAVPWFRQNRGPTPEQKKIMSMLRGGRGRQTRPLTADEKAVRYLAQTGRSTLTARQGRRVRKAQRAELGRAQQ